MAMDALLLIKTLNIIIYITSASQDFLLEMKKQLEVLGIHSSNINKNMSIKFNAKNTKKLCQHMYYDGFDENLCLLRKYSIYKSFSQ